MADGEESQCGGNDDTQDTRSSFQSQYVEQDPMRMKTVYSHYDNYLYTNAFSRFSTLQKLQSPWFHPHKQTFTM